MTEGRVDEVLRRALAPRPGTAARVAAAALQQPVAGPMRRWRLVALAALAVVLAIIGVALRSGPPAPVRAATVYSVGGLVVGASASGSVWIVSPGADPDPGRPSAMIVKGVQ